VREEHLLEAALVLLFEEYATAGSDELARQTRNATYRYLRSLDAALHRLSELAASEELRELYASLSSVTFPLACFAASGYFDTFFEAVQRALKAGFIDARALCEELNALLDDGLKQQFLAFFERYVGAELCGGGGS
jgi:Pyruvate/2-oxoacid:ferredoxin oxidoreductase gamma subunit